MRRARPVRGIREPDAPAEQGSPLIRATFAILVAITIFAILIESWSRRTDYRSQLAQSAIAAENVAQAAEEHVEGAINTVSWLLDGIVERVEMDGVSRPERGRLQEYLETRLGKKNSALKDLFVHDREGDCLVMASSPSLCSVNNADRHFFEYHRTHADREMRIGPPIMSRSSGEWIITLSRRWNDRHGNFAGIVLATIPVGYFERYYNRFAVGRHGAMLLALADGTVVAGRPAGRGLVNWSAADTPLFRFIRRNGQRGTAMLMVSFDGKERLMSYRRLDDYPLVVVAALARDDILADWWTVTRQECTAVVAMLLALYALGAWLVSHIRHKLQLEERLRRAQADLQARNATLDRLARTDALTGLHNRRYLDERIAAETARAAREGNAISLVMVDVDCFKRYNDMLGHAAGDDCLRRVAAAIGTAVHRPADVAARFGGEEFAILLPGTGREGALRVAESARAAVVALALSHEGNPAGIVTISAGVATIRPRGIEDGRLLVEQADGALYGAKEAGRNRVEVAARAAVTA
jgi:diguanylate cyclase (GGDEF)-like protein